MTKQIILFKYKTIFKSQSQIKFIILSKKQILKVNGRHIIFHFEKIKARKYNQRIPNLYHFYLQNNNNNNNSLNNK